MLTVVSTGGNPNGLAFDPDNQLLYITDNNSNGLYRYSIATSLHTLIGTISGGFTSVEGLGYDAVTATLFGLADDQDRIIKLNTTTAAGTALPNGLVAGIWRGLDFDPGTGLLFATRVNAGGILTSIDPLTGIGTDLGPITGSGTFTFIQGLAGQSFTPVPEPSTMVLTASGVALLGLGHWRRRRGAGQSACN
ncbi:MAG: PEP-CTERM sorting domain-containing protein [Lacunisphaera sp.]|nr:PEP-CTERM sorting domain-containing protein [Lacunisphaera sp.]